MAGCTGRAGPGILALEAWGTRHFSCRSLGTYACRQTRGGSGLSKHGLGLAVDLGGFHAPSAVGDAIAAWMVAHAAAIGAQTVIWNQRIWTGGGWRAYDPGPGGSPHTDHVHVDIDEAHAWTAPLTVQQLEAINAGQPGTPGAPASGGGGGLFPDLSAITGLFKALTDPAYWKRYATGVLGVILLAAAAALITRDNITTAIKETI